MIEIVKEKGKENNTHTHTENIRTDTFGSYSFLPNTLAILFSFFFNVVNAITNISSVHLGHDIYLYMCV